MLCQYADSCRLCTDKALDAAVLMAIGAHWTNMEGYRTEICAERGDKGPCDLASRFDLLPDEPDPGHAPLGPGGVKAYSGRIQEEIRRGSAERLAREGGV